MLSPVFLSGQRCTLQFRQQFHSTQLFSFFSFLYPFLLFPYHLSLLWLPRKQLLQFVGIIIPVFFAANSNRPSAGFFRDSATDWKFCLSFFFFCLFFRSPPILLQSERNETKEEEEEEEEEPADPAESLARPSSVSTCSAVRAAAAVAQQQQLARLVRVYTIIIPIEAEYTIFQNFTQLLLTESFPFFNNARPVRLKEAELERVANTKWTFFSTKKRLVRNLQALYSLLIPFFNNVFPGWHSLRFGVST